MAINTGFSLISKIGGFASSNGGEIPAFDPSTDRLFVVAGPVVEILDLADPTAPTKISDLPFNTDDVPADFALVPNSVAVGKVGTVSEGIVAIALAVRDDLNNQAAGQVQFFNTANGSYLGKVAVGFLPDMITFTPDGTRLLTANEGEPNEAYTVDPEGSISIIDLAGGVNAATVSTLDFNAFDGQKASLKADGVKLFGEIFDQNGNVVRESTVSEDLEPEYVAFSGDGSKAWVTLQENNAVAIVDIASATVESIVPLGFKDHSLPGNGLDASDRDGAINIQNWPIFGVYQPDSIASFVVAGETYYITANEGDARNRPSDDDILPAPFDGEGDIFSDGARIKDLVLDPTAFPNADELQADENIGRLTVTTKLGDTDNDGDFDQLYAFGSRSFSIWEGNGNLVFDSGAQFEEITAIAIPEFFNASNSNNNFDNRSDDKGPEPEGVTVGTFQDRTFAFIGLERIGGVMVYEVTNPESPNFIQYINTRNFTVDPETNLTDSGAEGLTFIAAEDSPNGNSLLVVSNEVSQTTAIFEIDFPTEERIFSGPGDEVLFAGIETQGAWGPINFDGAYDRIYTGAGNDKVDMTTADPLSPFTGNNTINTAAGDDEIFVFKNDIIYGGSGNDIFDATDSLGGNRMVGNAGNDTFFLGSGDRAFGSAGDDTFWGGEGGDNLLDGQQGRDTFWLVTGELPSAPNHIKNFRKADDFIGIQYAGVSSINDLTIGDNFVAIKGSVIGAGASDYTIATIAGIKWTGLDASNFIFA
jgi:hypothetical protein